MSEGLVVSALAARMALLDGDKVVAVSDILHVPVIGLEALR